MPMSTAYLNAIAGTGRTSITHIQLHSADPGASGTTAATTAARQAVTWAAVASGNFAMSGSLNFTGGAANGAVTHISYWSASTGGTYYGSAALTGDTTFNSAGEYTLTAAQINHAAA